MLAAELTTLWRDVGFPDSISIAWIFGMRIDSTGRNWTCSIACCLLFLAAPCALSGLLRRGRYGST